MMGDQSTRKSHVQRIFWEVKNVDRSHTYWVNTVQETWGFHSIRSSENSSLENGQEICHAFVDHVALLNGMSVNYQSGLIHGTKSHLALIMRLVNEITLLEENETEISIDYDHISDLVQPGTN
jgi:hypothetical protein